MALRAEKLVKNTKEGGGGLLLAMGSSTRLHFLGFSLNLNQVSNSRRQDAKPFGAARLHFLGFSLNLNIWGQVSNSKSRTRNLRNQGDRTCILQVRFDGGCENPCFYCQQVDSHQRNPHPCVNHDPFIEDTVENVDELGPANGAFKSHRFTCFLYLQAFSLYLQLQFTPFTAPWPEPPNCSRHGSCEALELA